MSTQSAALRKSVATAERILRLMRELELLSVGEVARRWGTTKEYVRRNVPIVKLGPKTHRVRLEDAVAFQQRRTQQL